MCVLWEITRETCSDAYTHAKNILFPLCISTKITSNFCSDQHIFQHTHSTAHKLETPPLCLTRGVQRDSNPYPYPCHVHMPKSKNPPLFLTVGIRQCDPPSIQLDLLGPTASLPPSPCYMYTISAKRLLLLGLLLCSTRMYNRGR